MRSDIQNTPSQPGVYIFKGSQDRILYVGKAKNLRNRLRSYFTDSPNLDNRKTAMVRLVKDVQWIVTDSELEALILESNLIKEHKPRFNIILRDDKGYPYLRITINDKWPRLEVVRRISDDGSIYFGPFVPAQSMWEALSVIRRHFLMIKCRHSLDKPQRPCVQYQMKRCLAPCSGLVTRDEYLSHVEDVRLFLNGQRMELIERYKEKMESYSERLLFEEAAMMRDKIQRLTRALEQQKIISPELGDIDVIACDLEEGINNVGFNVLFIRKGLLIGAKDFFINHIHLSDREEIIESFLQVFYSKDILPPPLILTGSGSGDMQTLQEWLRLKRRGDVTVRTPESSREYELIAMAAENARLHRALRTEKGVSDMPKRLKERLNLNSLPLRIGAFDISTLSGGESVGAFICWEEGSFKKELYRHMKIKTVEGIDDYAMMDETIRRTFSNLGHSELPSLVIIDGGIGHLETALNTIRGIGVSTEVVSIAKKPDRLFLPSGEVIDLEDRQKTSLFLKSLRNEVHRFVITFHRGQRSKEFLRSPLDDIPGIGMKRRLALLRSFGSLEAIRAATVEEIEQVQGINRVLAELVHKRLNNKSILAASCSQQC